MNFPSEARIQQEIVMWYRNTYCLKHHHPRCMILSIPNEQKPHLISTGLYPGAADILVIHYSKPYFFEVKNEKGRQSDKQKAFENHSIDAGVPYFLIRSLAEFQKIIISLK